MEFEEPTKLHRKSGMWGTQACVTTASKDARLFPSHGYHALYQGTTLVGP